MATPKQCVTCDTKIEYVKGKTQCLKCHLDKKQKIDIIDPYRKAEKKINDKLEIDPGFEILEKNQDIYTFEIQNESIGTHFFAILKFEIKKGKNKKFSFDEFHRNGDKNFFGDRPGIYLFTHTLENEKNALEKKKIVKVGETRNLSQRLRTHKSTLMDISDIEEEDCTQGLIVFCCTEDKKWPNDPLNSSELRLTIERILQANFETAKSRTEKWVTPTVDELDIAEKICKELFNIGGDLKWDHWKYDTLVFPPVKI